MSKVNELMGPQITTLYVQTMEEIATLRAERAVINENIREKLIEAKDLRKFVRLFNPQILDGEQTPTEPGDNGDE